jgi:hypothetical protein
LTKLVRNLRGWEVPSRVDVRMHDNDWGEIDDMIVTRRVLPAVQAIRQTSGCSLKRAIDLLSDRYRILRKRRPDDFTTGPDEYWDGVYS